MDWKFKQGERVLWKGRNGIVIGLFPAKAPLPDSFTLATTACSILGFGKREISAICLRLEPISSTPRFDSYLLWFNPTERSMGKFMLVKKVQLEAQENPEG